MGYLLVRQRRLGRANTFASAPDSTRTLPKRVRIAPCQRREEPGLRRRVRLLLHDRSEDVGPRGFGGAVDFAGPIPGLSGDVCPLIPVCRTVRPSFPVPPASGPQRSAGLRASEASRDLIPPRHRLQTHIRHEASGRCSRREIGTASNVTISSLVQSGRARRAPPTGAEDRSRPRHLAEAPFVSLIRASTRRAEKGTSEARRRPDTGNCGRIAGKMRFPPSRLPPPTERRLARPSASAPRGGASTGVLLVAPRNAVQPVRAASIRRASRTLAASRRSSTTGFMRAV